MASDCINKHVMFLYLEVRCLSVLFNVYITDLRLAGFVQFLIELSSILFKVSFSDLPSCSYVFTLLTLGIPGFRHTSVYQRGSKMTPSEFSAINAIFDRFSTEI